MEAGGDLLEVGAGVEDDVASGVVDGKGAGAVGVELVEAALLLVPAGRGGDLEIAGEGLVFEALGKLDALADLAVLDEVLDLSLVGVHAGTVLVAPFAGVALVGRREVGLAAGSKRADGVRHGQALDR